MNFNNRVIEKDFLSRHGCLVNNSHAAPKWRRWMAWRWFLEFLQEYYFSFYFAFFLFNLKSLQQISVFNDQRSTLPKNYFSLDYVIERLVCFFDRDEKQDGRLFHLRPIFLNANALHRRSLSFSFLFQRRLLAVFSLLTRVESSLTLFIEIPRTNSKTCS